MPVVVGAGTSALLSGGLALTAGLVAMAAAAAG